MVLITTNCLKRVTVRQLPILLVSQAGARLNLWDGVVLLNDDPTEDPVMTIVKFRDFREEALCVWYDVKEGEVYEEWFPTVCLRVFCYFLHKTS